MSVRQRLMFVLIDLGCNRCRPVPSWVIPCASKPPPPPVAVGALMRAQVMPPCHEYLATLRRDVGGMLARRRLAASSSLVLPAVAASASSCHLVRWASQEAAPAAGGGAKGGGALGAQVEPETLGQKVKKELVKTLKLNLVLMPVCFLFMLWMYPPVSHAEEKRLQERYQKSAGWKT